MNPDARNADLLSGLDELPPAAGGTLRTGVEAFAVAALAWLGNDAT